MVVVKRFFAFFIVLSLFLLLPFVSFARESPKVIAYYFHTTVRCFSCHKIEEFIEGALKEYFAKEIESGDLTYKVVNTENKGNEHFIQDYQLYTKSVVLALVQDDKEIKFKNLVNIWTLLGNKDKFYQYIKEETQTLLDEIKENK